MNKPTQPTPQNRALTPDEERAARDHWNEIENILNPITELTAERGSCEWEEDIETRIFQQHRRADSEELFINHLKGGEPWHAWPPKNTRPLDFSWMPPIDGPKPWPEGKSKEERQAGMIAAMMEDAIALNAQVNKNMRHLQRSNELEGIKWRRKPEEQKTHPADMDPQIGVNVCEWQVKSFEDLATRNPEGMKKSLAMAKAGLARARAELAAFEAGDPDWYKIGEAA